jgi:hypothetical protein
MVNSIDHFIFSWPPSSTMSSTSWLVSLLLLLPVIQVQSTNNSPEVSPKPLPDGGEVVGRRLAGGWTPFRNATSDDLDLWKRTMEKKPKSKTGDDLSALGDPFSVRTQVVAGTKYEFEFQDGSTVVVFEQSWSDTLEVLSVSGAADGGIKTKDDDTGKTEGDGAASNGSSEDNKTEIQIGVSGTDRASGCVFCSLILACFLVSSIL